METTEPAKQTRTAEELATIIRGDLSKLEGCPERDVNVTIYGDPWKAMLMFGAKAGPVPKKAELQQFLKSSPSVCSGFTMSPRPLTDLALGLRMEGVPPGRAYRTLCFALQCQSH